LTESEAQCIIAKELIFNRHYFAAVPNIKRYFNWEADLIVLNKSLYAEEYEIKCSRSDFLVDFKKPKHKRFAQVWKIRNDPAKSYRGKIPNRFWFACSGFEPDLSEIPSYAGLAIIENKDVFVIKQAPLIHKNACPKKFVLYLLRAACSRIWKDSTVTWRKRKYVINKF